MSGTKWTPGKWYSSGGTVWSSDAEDRGPIADCTQLRLGTHIDREQLVANAHLIAASSRLYAALEALVNGVAALYKAGRLPAATWLEARAALAAARGEEQT
jgi:hypothetical protein